MAIKMFVTDLDGTLLHRDHTISAENKKAIREAVDAGIVVTIATGRMYVSALPYAQELEVDVPIITYNGALIRSVAGEVLFDSYLAEDIVQQVYAFCRQRGWYIQVYSEDSLYFAVHDEKAAAYEKATSVTGRAVGPDGLAEVTHKVPKMLVVTSGREETEKVLTELRSVFGHRITAVMSNPEYAEIINIGVNKATAMQQLAAKLGIRIDEVMAIGDSNNDLPMLKAAGYSAAMGNANEAVKAVTDYVTADCDQDGVAAAIRKYVL